MRRTLLPTQTAPVAAAISAALLVCSADNALAQSLDDVVVSASRTEQRSFDAPGSIQAVDREVIEARGPQVNISEALAEVPGIHVANRNNFSQDLQISIRGFGSRAPFGVRGVRLLIDGIPQTLPDGQGQSSQFALTSAERIEVLKGPISLLYGNAAGGVLQVFTKSAGDRPEFSAAGYMGSDGLYRSSMQYAERKGRYGLVADISALESDGFRTYSRASRQQFNGKLDITGDRSKTTVVANILHNESEEPGSLTRGEFLANPFQAVAANVANRYGKIFQQGSLGITNQTKLEGDQTFGYRAYWGSRSLDNPLAVSTSTTGFSMIDRAFYGVGLSLSQRGELAGIPVISTFGLDADAVTDNRTARQNQAGVAAGQLGRQEKNLARNTDAYFQSQWLISERTTGLLGVRLSSIRLEVRDQFFTDADGDGSGKRDYKGVSPVVGITRHVSPALNVFAQYGRGFETPTLNEVLYTPNGINTPGNRFYSGIAAARSQQSEIGLKWRPNPLTRLDASVFHAETRDDIVPYFLSTSSSAWQNADTRRYGVEIAGLKILDKQWAIRAALTAMDATYRESLRTVRNSALATVTAGNTMPGVPKTRAFLDASWRSTGWTQKPGGKFSEAGLEFVATGDMQANSVNSEKASSYELFNARLATHIQNGGHRLSLYARVDNLLDKRYVGSVVADQAFLRFYEPGAPRSWLMGIRYTLQM